MKEDQMDPQELRPEQRIIEVMMNEMTKEVFNFLN